jgi:hypothetical protein
MTKNDVSRVLDRVRSWSEERQEEAAHMLLEMEAQDASPYRLTDEQLAEVRRRRAKNDPKLVSLTNGRRHFGGFMAVDETSSPRILRCRKQRDVR